MIIYFIYQVVDSMSGKVKLSGRVNGDMRYSVSGQTIFLVNEFL